LMFISAMLMYDIEHIAQPEVFDNALSSLWWAMATITTVGYGDIYPVTTAGRILSTFITFLGIFLTAIPTGIISAGFIEESSKRRSLKDHAQ
ncbi:MAG: two pore domain potassium channel family protein, partial [Erysipelothrix sp.]|nr:two pore domain potassium channel family protein [Erysipelothrix sp.]